MKEKKNKEGESAKDAAKSDGKTIDRANREAPIAKKNYNTVIVLVIAIIIGVGGYKWYEKNKNYKQEVDRLSRKYTSFIRDFDAKVDPLVLENTLKSIEKTAKEKDINTITYKNRSINLIDEIKSKRKRIENMKKTLPTVNVGEKWDKIQRLQDEGECFEILYMLSDLELELSKFSLSDQEKYKQYKENARSQNKNFTC